MIWHIVLALFLGYLAGLFTAVMFAMSSRDDDWKDSQ